MPTEELLFSQFKKQTEEIIKHLREEIALVRTGKASPSLVENLMVETYQGQAKLTLRELATITTEGPFGLLISPFDSTIIKDIEKAILKSPLNLTPVVDGKNIHLKIPPLSEEQRKNLLKLVSQKIEESRERIRSIRDEIRKKIKKSFENKEITEDEKYRIEKELDHLTQHQNQQINQIKDKKEKELMEI